LSAESGLSIPTYKSLIYGFIVQFDEIKCESELDVPLVLVIFWIAQDDNIRNTNFINTNICCQLNKPPTSQYILKRRSATLFYDAALRSTGPEARENKDIKMVT
jgi:hypothetical protein